MKYINQLLLLIIVSLITAISYIGISGTWSYIFTVPLIIIVGFIVFYLYKQFESDEKDRKQKALKLAIEDEEAGKWIKDSFLPQAIGFGLQNRKTLLIYFFIFIISIYFLWHFISYGFENAIYSTLTGAAFLLLFMIYVFIMSSITAKMIKFIPENLRKIVSSDWIRAYIYLLPVAFIAYLFNPTDTSAPDFNNKLFSVPLFILIYTFLFLGIYSIFYLYSEINKDAEIKPKNEFEDIRI